MAGSLKRIACRTGCVFLALGLLGGCATGPKGPDPRDPFEPMNRGIYEFNERIDKAILQPTARAYRTVLPQFVRQSVSNVFSNLNDVRVALNNALQGKFTTAYSDMGRVLINSSLGILGLFDIASEAGIEKHQEDFGQTLGWWGLRDGPYLVLPLFGPSSGRDVVGFGVDWITDPVTYVDPSGTRYVFVGTRLVNRRAELLDASKVLDTAALDQYEFVRDAYLQRRRNLVYDGNPPRSKDDLGPPPKPDAAPVKPAPDKK
jgi:phospholipid-binding lipoprotein MlaA